MTEERTESPVWVVSEVLTAIIRQITLLLSVLYKNRPEENVLLRDLFFFSSVLCLATKLDTFDAFYNPVYCITKVFVLVNCKQSKFDICFQAHWSSQLAPVMNSCTQCSLLSFCLLGHIIFLLGHLFVYGNTHTKLKMQSTGVERNQKYISHLSMFHSGLQYVQLHFHHPHNPLMSPASRVFFFVLNSACGSYLIAWKVRSTRPLGLLGSQDTYLTWCQDAQRELDAAKYTRLA